MSAPANLLLLLALASPAATALPLPAGPQEEPQTADLGQLLIFPGETTVTGARGDSSLLEVLVRNPHEVDIEPLAFRLHLEGTEEREVLVMRGSLPLTDRIGQPIAAGQRGTYTLEVPTNAGDLKELRITVENARVHLDSYRKAEAPRVSGLSNEDGRDRIAIENTDEREVEVLVRVDFGPRAHPTVHRLRLGPSAQMDWMIPQPPTRAGVVEGAARAVDVRVLDVLAFEPRGEPDPSAELFSVGLESWNVTRSPADGSVGIFEFDHAADGAPAWVQGTFEVVGDGVVLSPATSWGGDLEQELLREAFHQLLGLGESRGTITDLLDTALPELVLSGEREHVLLVRELPQVGLDGPGLLALRSGRIAWTSGPELGSPPLSVWESVPHEKGYLRVRRDTYLERVITLGSPDTMERWVLDGEPGPDRRPLALEWRRRSRSAPAEEGRLSLRHIRQRSSSPAVESQEVSPVLQELREAWESVHTFSAPGEWRIRFEAIAPGPRTDWGERSWLSGTLALHGLRRGGFLRAEVTSMTDPASVPDEEVEEPSREGGKREGKRRAALPDPLDGENRLALEVYVEDVLGAWARLDPSHRPPFDVLFSRATARRLGQDIVLENAPYRRIRIQNGLPVLLISADGSRTEIEYLAVPEGALPVRIQSRGQRLELRYAQVDNRWLPRGIVVYGAPPVAGLATLILKDWRD